MAIDWTPTDDEIMEGIHEALRKIPRMHEPKDTRKRAAFLLAHNMIEKAREYLEEVYKKGDGPEVEEDEPPHEPDPLAYGEASPGVGWM